MCYKINLHNIEKVMKLYLINLITNYCAINPLFHLNCCFYKTIT